MLTIPGFKLSRLQRIYHPRGVTLCFSEGVFGDSNRKLKLGQAYFFSRNRQDNGKHCIVTMDSDLEAFSRYPTRGSFAALSFQTTAFANYAD